jgi:hypothetical protein
MATISKNWAALQELYKTNYYGGSDADVGGTEQTSSDIDLETGGHEGAHCFLEYYPSGGTDDLKVKVYASLDGTNYDTVPLTEFTVDNPGATTEGQLSFVVKDVAHFRVGLVRDGSTDTYDIQLTCQKWNYTSS